MIPLVVPQKVIRQARVALQSERGVYGMRVGLYLGKARLIDSGLHQHVLLGRRAMCSTKVELRLNQPRDTNEAVVIVLRANAQIYCVELITVALS